MDVSIRRLSVVLVVGVGSGCGFGPVLSLHVVDQGDDQSDEQIRENQRDDKHERQKVNRHKKAVLSLCRIVHHFVPSLAHSELEQGDHRIPKRVEFVHWRRRQVIEGVANQRHSNHAVEINEHQQ